MSLLFLLQLIPLSQLRGPVLLSAVGKAIGNDFLDYLPAAVY